MMKNNTSNFFSNIIGNAISLNGVRNLARFFRINYVGQKMYVWLFAPKHGIIEYVIENLSAQFYAKNYRHLMYLTTTIFAKDANESYTMKKLFENIEPGQVVYDIGAFIGFHGIFLAKHVGANGRVISFEPYAKNRQALMENIALNQIKNITVVPVALGDREDKGLIHGDDFTIRKEGSLGEKVTVAVGDQVVLNNNFPLPNAVKIDVDGFEYKTILGLEKTLTSETCRFLSCEIHPTLLPKDETPEMILDLVKRYGFTKIERYDLKDVFHIFAKKVSN
jgi:FkbM family methyltransferase